MKLTRLVKFMYTIYLQTSTLHTDWWRVGIVAYCPLFSAYNMSESGSAPGSSWEDERPLFNAGFVDTQGWAVGLRDYIATMKD